MMFSTPTRRDLLKGLSCGFGYAAQAGLAAEAAAAERKRQEEEEAARKAAVGV